MNLVFRNVQCAFIHSHADVHISISTLNASTSCLWMYRVHSYTLVRVCIFMHSYSSHRYGGYRSTAHIHTNSCGCAHVCICTLRTDFAVTDIPCVCIHRHSCGCADDFIPLSTHKFLVYRCTTRIHTCSCGCAHTFTRTLRTDLAVTDIPCAFIHTCGCARTRIRTIHTDFAATDIPYTLIHIRADVHTS